MSKLVGCYSIVYTIPDDPDDYAVDWNWQVPDVWACSSREYGIARPWDFNGKLIVEDDFFHLAIAPEGEAIALIMGKDGKALSGRVEAHLIPGFKEHAYQAILEHFGLEKWTEEFPPEKIVSMSPAELARERHLREIQHQLPKMVFPNFTLGGLKSAEDYP